MPSGGYRPRWTPEPKLGAEIVALYGQGYSSHQIVDKLGITEVTHSGVVGYLKRQGVTVRTIGKTNRREAKCVACSETFTAGNINTILCLTCAPDKRWRQVYRLYGITKLEFEAMWERQSGLCELCEEMLVDDDSTVIDHCHNQGHVRALLHRGCNLGLAFIENDKFLANAVRYIERHKK